MNFMYFLQKINRCTGTIRAGTVVIIISIRKRKIEKMKNIKDSERYVRTVWKLGKIVPFLTTFSKKKAVDTFQLVDIYMLTFLNDFCLDLMYDTIVYGITQYYSKFSKVKKVN